MESVVYFGDITTSSDPDNVLKTPARANCQNRADEVNFNKYGVKDNTGLVAASEIFCDRFILQLKCESEDGGANELRALLNLNNMPKAGVLSIDSKNFKIA